MLVNFPFFCPDQLHSVPIAQMGNYQDFLKAAPQPLRDADPEQPKRLHTFGNPFKLDKKASPTDPYQFWYSFTSDRCKPKVTELETGKLTISFTPLSGHDDWWGGWVCDWPSEQGEETGRQQQHVGRRAQETSLHVAPAASGQGLHPSSNTPCQPSINSRWDFCWTWQIYN